MTSPYNNAEVPFSAASQARPAGLEDPLACVTRSLNQPATPLLAAFFNVTNIDIIQNTLRAIILQKTRYVIDRQSDTDLVVIMRKVYAEHASNAARGAVSVRDEVMRLNDIVLGIAVPMVASGVTAYLNYIRDASRLPEPLPRGTQTSVKGTKTFELFRGI